jgi:hypothetical protein
MTRLIINILINKQKLMGSGVYYLSNLELMDFQKILVGLTFLAALLFLLRKFIWIPITDSRKKSLGTLDGGKTKCGSDDCQCH